MNEELITPGVKASILAPVLKAVAEGKYADPGLLESVIAYSAIAFGGKSGKTTGDLPENLKFFVNKAIHESYKILDRDFEKLNAAGYSDEEATDIALAAGAGAAYGRLQMSLSAMGKEI